MAAGMMFTSIPSDTLPPLGADVWIKTASGGRLRANSLGTSESRMGR